MRREIIGDYEHELIEVTTIDDSQQGILRYICRYCNYREEKIKDRFDYDKLSLGYIKYI